MTYNSSLPLSLSYCLPKRLNKQNDLIQLLIKIFIGFSRDAKHVQSIKSITRTDWIGFVVSSGTEAGLRKIDVTTEKNKLYLLINNTSNKWKTEVNFKKNVTGVNLHLKTRLAILGVREFKRGMFGHCRICLTKKIVSAGQNVVWRVFPAS